ncbi:unnamed protein product [Rhodiola kirilowii]
MHFYLTQLGFARYLTENTPMVAENETDHQVLMAYNVWKDAEYLCRNYVLNSLNDVLYKVYCTKTSTKELWESLDQKYRTENAGSKKYIVGCFLEFQMVDSKTVTSQVQDLQLIMHEMNSEGMKVNEPFQVAAVIEKLPSGWKDFKNYLKHKRKEMSMEDLVIRLKNEEDNRLSDKRINLPCERANMVEHGDSSKVKKPFSKHEPRSGAIKKKVHPKFTGKCFNCDKEGHRAAECKKPQKKKKKANVAEVEEDLLVAVISQLSLVDSNPKEWCLDTGATHHICSDKNAFSELKLTDVGEKVYMGNSATSEVKGKGSVVLKMTSGKELKLTNVSYVPDIRNNLVSGALLDAHGFKIVFESQKVVLSKNGMYVGRGYVKDGMWKLIVIAIKSINKESSSTYLLESSNLWHGRLGHVNYDSIRNLMKLDCILKLQIDSEH